MKLRLSEHFGQVRLEFFLSYFILFLSYPIFGLTAYRGYDGIDGVCPAGSSGAGGEAGPPTLYDEGEAAVDARDHEHDDGGTQHHHPPPPTVRHRATLERTERGSRNKNR